MRPWHTEATRIGSKKRITCLGSSSSTRRFLGFSSLASCSWPGATAQQVEQFVTRPIEDAVAENKNIHPGTAADYGIRSISIPGFAYVYVQLAEDVSDVKRQFSDINLKLNALNSQLPPGAGPISFQSDFGDTAAL